MADRKILSLVGGISKDSLNQKLLRAVDKLKPDGITLETFEINRLPFFSQDLEKDVPAPVQELKKKVLECDGLLFITPEYNRSFPGVLKNALDWGSRPYGQNSWNGKPAGVMGASLGAIGTFGAQHHLRQVLSYLNLPVVNQPEFYLNAAHAFDATGHLSDEKTADFIKKYWSALIALIELYRK